MQTRYFVTDTDMTSPDTAKTRWFGTCPVWARQCRDAGLVVVSEPVAVVGAKARRCDVPECGQMHLPVPPPWNDTFAKAAGR